jgi:hypothetical protein
MFLGTPVPPKKHESHPTVDLTFDEDRTLSWSDVMNYRHGHWGWQGDFSKAAKVACYPYYCWNDRIYTTDDDRDTGWTKDNVR